MDRRRAATVAIGVIVAVSAGGFVIGARTTTPAEVASRTAAPVPSSILVPVEERVLATEVVGRGTGRYGAPQKLSVPTSTLKSSAGLVAELPTVGQQLDEGDVVASAGGRPVLLLVGARPMSRDLGPGSSGDDVRQLEDGLARLGFDPGPIDGQYDQATAGGVEAWYLANGYAPFTATTEQLAAIRARTADLAVASFESAGAATAASDAQVALATANSAATTAVRHAEATARSVDRARAEADAANAVAQQEVTSKRAALDRLTAPAPATAAQVRTAEIDLAAARTNETSVRAAGQRAVADAQSELDQAPARLEAARLTATAADAAATADLAARQAAYDALTADPASTPTQIAAALAELATAQASSQAIHAAGVQSVTDASTLLANVPLVLEQVRTDSSAAVALAVAEVAARELALATLTNPPPPTAAEVAAATNDLAVAIALGETVRLAGERAVDDASGAAADAGSDVLVTAAATAAAVDAVATAQAALAARTDLESRAGREAELTTLQAGVQVPADEVVFVASGPVRVAELSVVLGDLATGALMSVTDSIVHVDAGLALADAALVTVGMTARLDEPDLGVAADAVVAVVAEAPGTNGVDGFHVYVSLDVAAPPTNLAGASVRLTIPVDSSGSAVLAVPVSAVTLAADGSSRVQRSVGQSVEFVTVIPGLSSDGYVGLTVPDGALRAGDLVVVGVEQATAAPLDTIAPLDTTAPVATESTSSNAISNGSTRRPFHPSLR